MSSDKSLVGGEDIDHDESIGEKLESLQAEIDEIHIDLPSTAERHEDGEEITAVASRDANNLKVRPLAVISTATATASGSGSATGTGTHWQAAEPLLTTR